jgi:succinate dehydrogenase flavin-adding protein (antitoxin of CptAB toxin-antitoxin module)
MSDADRIRWRCRRGMLELDLVLTAFLDRNFATLAPRSVDTFCALLERPDPELLDFVMGHQEPVVTEERELVALLRAARPLNMVQLH